MTFAFFYRGLLTEAIRAFLETELAYPVAVADIPDDAGWQGEPRAAGVNFIPFTVITPLTASQSQGGLDAPQDYWQVPYALTTYGADPKQAEWQADRARGAMQGLLRQEVPVGPVTCTIDGIWLTSMGTLQRTSDAQQYPWWGQSDALVVRISY